MKNLTKLTFLVMLAAIIVSLQSCSKEKNATPVKSSATLGQQNLSGSIGNLVDMDINLNDSCYYWYRTGMMSVGTDISSAAYIALKPYTLPTGKTPYDVVAVGIAKTSHVFFWYDDGTVSEGTSTNASAYAAPISYTVPSGETVTNIVAMSIAKQGSSNVYTWYKDGTATVGSTTNLASVRSNYAYTVASGKTVSDIVGIGINGSDDHTFVWYNDGTTKTVSSGITNQFDYYFGTTTASF
jgi:hypothetical protein